jgi:hypothetical protein
MAKTLALKKLMMELGGTTEYVDAEHSFVVVGTKNAKRRAKAGRCDYCFFSCSLYDAGHRINIVAEKFTYIQFGEFGEPWTRYKNCREMQEEIRLNDSNRIDEIPIDEQRELGVPTGCDVKGYASDRNRRIKNGEHIVVSRRSPSVYPVKRKNAAKHTRAW